MSDFKHYVRLDPDDYIIHAYSNAFESFADGDICIEEHGERRLVINGAINPLLFSVYGGPLYRYVDGMVVSDAKAMPIVPNEIEELKARLRIAERATIENSEANQGLLELLIEMEVI